MKHAKIVTIDKIYDLVKSDSEIVVGMAANEPQVFMKDLHTIEDKVKNVTVTNCLPITEAEFFTNEDFKDSFYVDSWFFTKSLRRASKHGNISFIPNHLHLAGQRRLDYKKPNIFITAATPPDKHGFMSVSTSNVYEKDMVEA
nr:4-hydroxybutyrate--acetyl-CoA CoA transferase [Mycoplasmatota bacterium]